MQGGLADPSTARLSRAAGSSLANNLSTNSVRSAALNDDFFGITNLQAAINYPHSRIPDNPEQDIVQGSGPPYDSPMGMSLPPIGPTIQYLQHLSTGYTGVWQNAAMNRSVIATWLCAFAVVTFATAQAPQLIGSWTVVQSVDLITDEDKSYAHVVAFDRPQHADRAGPSIMCSASSDNGIFLAFMADRYLGTSDFADITYRVDGGQPLTGRWLNLDTAVAPMYADEMNRVLQTWFDAGTMVFRVSTRLATYTYQVDIAGLRAAIGALGCYRGPM